MDIWTELVVGMILTRLRSLLVDVLVLLDESHPSVVLNRATVTDRDKLSVWLFCRDRSISLSVWRFCRDRSISLSVWLEDGNCGK